MDAPRPQKTVALHQPVYLPFPGYFQKMARADEFLVMDFVQLHRQSWQLRNRVKTAAGATWLSVPVYVKGRLGQLIRDVRVVEGPWRRKHWETLRQSYGAAPYWRDYADFFAATYARPWDRLADLNLHLMLGMREMLGITTPLADAGAYEFEGAKTDLVVDICRKLGATAYLSSDGEAAYIEEEKFAAAALAHAYLGWEPTPYPQLHGDFIPGLSTVDVLFNCGPRSLDVVMGKAFT